MANDLLIPTEGKASVVTSLLKINGEEVPATYEVLQMTVLREANKIPYAKLILKDGEASKGDFPAANTDLFIPGNEIEVLVGYNANEDLLFKGIIVKQGIKIKGNGSSWLKLDCRDKTFRATLQKRSQYFTELTDSDVVQDLLNKYELDLDVDSTEVTYRQLVQYEQSDWEYILDRANVNGFFCLVDDGTFALKKPDFSQESQLTLTYGASILEFDAEMDARLQYDGVNAQSWDPSNQELLEVEALEPDMEEAGNLSVQELATASGSETYTLSHSGHLAQDELQKWADATLQDFRLSKIRGRVKFHGTVAIKPGMLVTLQGVGDRFNGIVFVSGVRHEIQEGIWATDIQFGLPDAWDPKDLGLRKTFPEILGLQIGVVTQLQDDPEAEHRILVKIPALDQEAEGVWARVMSPDAGEERGMFFLPEIGDEVVVGFLNNDPKHPVVQGMLHSSNKITPLEASDDNHEKGYVSRSGIKILFDDDKTSVTLETPAGKKIVLDEDAGSITLEDDNNNKLVMNSDGIVIESGGKLELKSQQEVKIDGGTDLALKAGAGFKAEGTSGAEVTTNAVAVLKGSLVQIN